MANPTPVSFRQIVKNPIIWGYFTIVTFLVSLAWYFVYNTTDITKKNDSDCQQEKLELRQELREERTKNDNLVNAILLKNGVIDKLTTITDSLNKKPDETK
jgi:hypothetical protein